MGLGACVSGVGWWWGRKFLAPSFEWVSRCCGLVFRLSYLWMLIGRLRTLLFPELIWASDKDREERLEKRRAIQDAATYKEGDV